MAKTPQMEGVQRAIALSRWLTALGIAAVVAILLSIGLTLSLSHSDATRAAARSADNLLLFIGNEVTGTLESFTTILEDLAEAAQNPTLTSLPEEERQRLLVNRADRTKSFGAIAIVDAEGTVRLTSSEEAVPPINVSDRDYFAVQRTRRDNEIYISRPFLSRGVDRAPSIAISLRRSAPNSSFDGIIMAVIKLARLRALLNAAQLGADSYANVLRSDGIMLLRTQIAGSDEPSLGIDVSKSAAFQQFLRKGPGTYDAISAMDGTPRRYTITAVRGLPLVISVSQSLNSIYQEWNRRAFGIMAVTLLSCIAIVALTALFRRELLRRARAESALVHLAAADGLTGIANRRRFDAVLEREWQRATRTDQPLALLMIDVDHFKAFNDKHGHGLGDDLLIAIAATLTATARRPADLVARYGGEEFSVILPDTDLTGAAEIAERIRAAVEVTVVATPGDRLLRATVSIGVAVRIPGLGGTPADLLRAADTALYAAKGSGRNVVVREDGPALAFESVAAAV